MFDFAWSEIALIGVVALVLIGPKDMPVAIKAVTTMIKKARKMAAEFQTHVDDMVKDTELADVRNSIREIRSLDIRGTITRTLDQDGSIRSALADPMRTPPPVLPADVTPVEPLPEHTIAAPVDASAAVDAIAPSPAFIPPEDSQLPAAALTPAPAFIPPESTPPVQAAPHAVPPAIGSV